MNMLRLRLQSLQYFDYYGLYIENSSKTFFFHFEGHSYPAVRQHILIDIYLFNKLIYNLNLVQVEQCMKLNHEVHRGVTFFH